MTCGNERIVVNIDQYGCAWYIWCDEYQCGGEGLDPVDAIRNFFQRLEEYHECGQ